MLRADLRWDGDLGDAIVYLLVRWIYQRFLARRNTWKVGVLVYRDSTWGGRFRVMHKELLGVEPVIVHSQLSHRHSPQALPGDGRPAPRRA